MRKFVLSVENPDIEKRKQVFASSKLEDVREYINKKYRGAVKGGVTKDELFNQHVVDKYYYTIRRTLTVQTKLTLRIICIKLED